MNQAPKENWIDRYINRRNKRKEKRIELWEDRKKAKFKWLEKKAGLPHQKAFFLVFWMLVSLTLLVILIVFFPIFLKCFISESGSFETVLDYSKWVISALLAAFGAWIGAGAAYFFGKENLHESSRATEEALRIQQKSLGTRLEEKVYVKDLNLTAMNPKFMFDPSMDLEKVVSALNEKLSYWFVPIVNAESGILEDVVASQAFHKYTLEVKEEKKNTNEGPFVKDLIEYLDKAKDEVSRKLHGVDVFFIKIKLNDTLHDVADRMRSANTAVAIIVDAKGKPTHCLTRTDIGSMLKPEE